MRYQAYVDNIGMIGEFNSLDRAKKAVRQTIANSARADKHGYVMDYDHNEIVYETGTAREW